MFPNQVFLSQKQPASLIRIDHLKEVGTEYEFPSGTYAYTTLTDQVYLLDKPVSVESFWLRLHRSPNPFVQDEIGVRYVKLYLGSRLVAESKIVLWSDEWYLIVPNGKSLIGDRLVIEKGTDLDSLIIQWGQVIPSAMAQQEDQKRISAFNAYQVTEKKQEEVKAALEKTQDPKKREKLLAEANYTIQ